MNDKDTIDATTQAKLWLIASKLHGIAALIKNWNGEPLGSREDTHNALYGLGALLEGIAHEVKEIWGMLDREDSQEDTR